MARIYVDRSCGKLERTDLYLVRLTLSDGRVFDDLEPRRLFPLTDTEHYITLLDSKEREVALIKSLSELDEDSRAALEACFGEYYLIPRITQVLSIEDKFGTLSFHVMTDRGEISFRIRNRHSDIKMLYGTSRVLIRDADDNRYEIPELDALDRHSKRLLFSYV